jgi:hypothetical protein
MKKLVILITVILASCGEKPISTTIPGLDLSKPQSVDYFRENYDKSKEFNEWCLKNMLDPVPKDKISIMFYDNCQKAQAAIMSPQKSIESQRKYNSY